jgi:glycosyltransferase involved in cell wall biosynthesis
MKKTKVSVSVLTANYNNSEFLRDFFDSILDSTFLPEEIIIVDDCSVDKSLDIIVEYQKIIENLKIIKLDSNVGFANALNIGLNHVTKNYILRIDPDDILDRFRIEKQWTFALNNPGIDIIGSNVCYFIGHIKNIIGTSNFPIETDKIIGRYKSGYHGLVHGSILIKSNILVENKYDQNQVPAEEYDLFSRLLTQGFLANNITESLTYVRIHNSSASFNYPLSTFIKIRRQQVIYWDKEISDFNFYRKYFMIKFYRKSLTNEVFFRYFYKFVAAIFAPELIINRIKNSLTCH